MQTVQISRVHQVMAATGASRETAVSYLVAEEWNVADAIASLQADQQA